MEKKRKRASFSITTEPPNPSEKVKEVVQDDPALKQVVEVIVEDKTKSGRAPNINIVIPQPHHEKTSVDADVVQAVNNLPNVIDDGTDEEQAIPQKYQQVVAEVAEDTSEPEDDEIEDDDSIVTASATPHGDTVVVRNDPEEREDQSSSFSHHQRVEVEEEDVENELRVENKLTEDEQQPKKVPAIKIHMNGQAEKEYDTERKETVAELFSNSSHSVMPEITVHKHTHTRGIILWALTMVAIALGVGGGLVLFTNRYNQPSSPAVEISPTAAAAVPTAVATVTPTPAAVRRGDIRIQVLNGGGKAGAASRMKAFLEGKGYRVVETGNADSYSYETTEIVVKESQVAIVDTLAGDLEESYELGESSTDLPESSSYDARVIVGENE